MFVEIKEAGEVTEAPARTLKLSEAMRIGASLRPQCKSFVFFDGKSCAIGAAYEAVFGHPGEGAHLAMCAPSHIDPDRLILDKVLNKFRARHLSMDIWQRNDVDGWSREQIADWLETQGY